MTDSAKIKLPPKLIPVFSGEADVRSSWGGRGSGKTRSFAKMSAVRAYMWAAEGRTGIILCARQFMNSLDDSSLAEVKAAIQEEPFLNRFFDIGEKYIRTKCGRVHYKFSGLDQNIDSVKSKAKILLCWVDEAEPVSDEAWQTLIPTLREEDSELWVTWNPKRKKCATENRFRNSKDPRVKGVELNYRDNPKFPAILERQRQRDLIERPDTYGHIWEGEHATAIKGAYYASALAKAKGEGRISFVPEDPTMIVRLVCDIGGTGAKSDNFVIWAVQFIGKEIRFINHYEVKGQPIASHLNWMRENEYTPARAKVILPHDGAQNDKVFDVSYESAFSKAGYNVEVIPNQGKGAASLRVEAARRLFNAMWFDEKKTEAGRDALGFYHEKWDDVRDIGLGPDHDWSSHSSDAFGLVAISYEEPTINKHTGPLSRGLSRLA